MLSVYPKSYLKHSNLEIGKSNEECYSEYCIHESIDLRKIADTLMLIISRESTIFEKGREEGAVQPDI